MPLRLVADPGIVGPRQPQVPGRARQVRRARSELERREGHLRRLRQHVQQGEVNKLNSIALAGGRGAMELGNGVRGLQILARGLQFVRVRPNTKVLFVAGAFVRLYGS